MSTDILRFKRGETVEISVIFDVLDDLGISALTGFGANILRRRLPAFRRPFTPKYAWCCCAWMPMCAEV